MGKLKKRERDPGWEHCTKVTQDKKARMLVKCKHCGKDIWGGVFRIKHHLAGTSKDTASCIECPDEVRSFFQKYLGANSEENQKEENVGFGDDECIDTKIGKVPTQKKTLNTIWKAKDREDVGKDICRCFYANALPFNLVKDSFFKAMLNSIAEYGKGLIPPSYHEVRVSFLKNEVASIQELVGKYKDEWKKNGCTLMSDGWSDNRNRSITNFLVNSPRGTVFLNSVDTSDIFKNANNLFELLDSMIEEIGEENVVQVVTDSASAYVKAGEMLMEKRKKLFWNPCAAHCMDLILKDIGDLAIHRDTMSKARKITVYIYR